ncbi:MAG: alpha/beta hydrolase [Planctomycetes bacterium]|nr:alpha/beta hydrolase [Planctomycetota bacterium]
MSIRIRFWIALCLLGSVLVGCRVTDIPIWESVRIATDGPCEVHKIGEIPYCDGPRLQAHRHTLDLYLPKGRRDFPVVFLVHGGAWVYGDNRCCGLYSSVGEFLARHGIGAVLPNYRLSPLVKHPEHIKDVARAFAWTRHNIGKYGGAVDQLFLAGHSAGGHLVALLATDECYLRDEGLKTDDIRGVIAVSGVYNIPPGMTDFTLGGRSAVAFHLRQVGLVRGEPEPDDREHRLKFKGIPMRIDPYWPAFGSDPDKRAAASPLNHVRPGLPPFLIMHADNDLPTLPTMAREFHEALRKCGVEATLLEVPRRNHSSICFRAIESEDVVARAALEFVNKHTKKN